MGPDHAQVPQVIVQPPSPYADAAALAQAAGSLAQVAIAGVAIYLAWRANRLNQDSHFVGSVVRTLLDAQLHARKVRRMYHHMFDTFTTAAAKQDARSAWLLEREEVAGAIANLAEMFEDLVPIKKAWDAVEEHEDTHVVNDALKIASPEVVRVAQGRYDQVHQAFVAAVSDAIRTLRRDGLRPKQKPAAARA